jgi:hypothetical protein
VSQDKFSVLKIMPRYNFGEFMDFLPKGFNPFKIQSVLELEFLLFFYSKSRENWKLGQKGCLFVLNLSINLPNLEIFGVK